LAFSDSRYGRLRRGYGVPGRAHFWPFTDVLRRIPRCVTRKEQKLENQGFRGCRG